MKDYKVKFIHAVVDKDNKPTEKTLVGIVRDIRTVPQFEDSKKDRRIPVDYYIIEVEKTKKVLAIPPVNVIEVIESLEDRQRNEREENLKNTATYRFLEFCNSKNATKFKSLVAEFNRNSDVFLSYVSGKPVFKIKD